MAHHQLRREDFDVARCTVARLMTQFGLCGAVRGKVINTTQSDTAAPCQQDKVNRQFRASAPNMPWVSDLTYVSTWAGFVCVAFVIDTFANHIVGWRVSGLVKTDFVLDALEQALYKRRPNDDGSLVHHSDHGSQGGFNRSSQHSELGGVDEDRKSEVGALDATQIVLARSTAGLAA